MNKVIKCGCGRSPTGNCIGWHNLTEQEYLERKGSLEDTKIKINE